MQSVVRLLSLSVATAALLAGCGGGVTFFVGDDDDHDHPWEPVFSGRNSSIVIDGTDNRLDGTWSTTNTELTQVLRFNATPSDPQTCRFQFYGLRQEGQDRFLDGEVRYLPDTGAPRTVFIGIGPREYRVNGGPVTVNRTTDRVNFNGAIAQSLQVPGETITLTGGVPLPRERDAGC
jgi:hypothetical protein